MAAKKVKLGKNVPDFTLPASDGREVSLSDFLGRKVVIYFYPQDLTPTCTQQSCDFRDVNTLFKELNTEVIGISPDDYKSHRKFIDTYHLPFLLLSDEDRKVCDMFDVWQLKKLYGREYMGIERSTFLINEKGKLIKEWRKVRLKKHTDTVLEAVKGSK